MQSSATVTLRAFVMMACAVIIPVFAMSGASWPDILKKFQDFRFPALLDPAAASTTSSTPPATLSIPTTTLGEAPRFAAGSPTVEPPTAAALSVSPANPADAALVSTQFDGIPSRLQALGATYYVLESWGNQQQYRFFCKMAVGGDADYTHCFEAIEADPLQAMRQVMRQVEAWRSETADIKL